MHLDIRAIFILPIRIIFYCLIVIHRFQSWPQFYDRTDCWQLGIENATHPSQPILANLVKCLSFSYFEHGRGALFDGNFDKCCDSSGAEEKG